MSIGLRTLQHVGRSLLRYWGVGLLNVLGLSIGFAAALIIGLFIKNELSFDRFIPDADKVLLVSSVYSPLNSQLVTSDKSPAGLASWLRTNSQAVANVARLNPVDWSVQSSSFHTLEHFYWADPNLFRILKLRAIAGNLQTALDKPSTAVITQRMARRYFGRDDVVGQTLVLNGNSPVQITAVLADFPSNTSLKRELFVSGLTPFSMLTALDFHSDWQWSSCYTFLRLKPGASLTADEVRQIAAHNWHNPYNLPTTFRLVALSDLHFQPEADSQISFRGHRDTVVSMGAVDGLILFLAAVNFAGLMAAQIDERRSEMAIRRSLGASQIQTFLHQFLEVIGVSLLSTLCAIALTERILPLINPLLGLQLNLWESPLFALTCACGVFSVGTLGGLYPALRLSATPTTRSTIQKYPKGLERFGRVNWIAIQFTLLLMLLISSQVVYQQWAYATETALKFDPKGILQIDTTFPPGRYENFARQVAALPGVQDVSFSHFLPEETDIRPGWSQSPSGRTAEFNRQSVDTNFFKMFGVQLLAGRNFSGVYYANRPADEVILSRAAAQALGYTRISDAVGKTLIYEGDHRHLTARIIGVVDDMRVDTVREPSHTIVFDNQSYFFTRLNVRLAAGKETTTLAEIDRLWALDHQNADLINRHFYTDYLSDLYQDIVQQWWAFCMLSIVGICLSAIGISGLSIYLARTRLREIAVRSALGATGWDLFVLRIQPFIVPLMIANGLGAIAAWGLMSWWLSSFVSHAGMSPEPFVISGTVTIIVALATVSIHSLLAKPARSSHPLRSE